jgi:RNA polymerase sigma-70 factor (ECF subfamily)
MEGSLREVESFYRRHFPLLREKCRRMLGDAAEAEDLAQETFVRLWRADLDADDPRAVTSWIYRTSTRLAIDRIRARARQARPEARDEEGASELERVAAPSSPSDEALSVRRQLQELARSLPAQELEIALLHRLDGLTQLEIADVLQISDRTVRRCLSRLDERLPALRLEISK